MTRVKGGPRAHKKHKKIIKLAEGYRGTRSTLFKRAQEAVFRAGEHSFAGRKQRKRQLRTLWIQRINAALSKHKLRYSTFIRGLKDAKLDLNRKTLAEMALNDPNSFEKVVEEVKKTFK